VTSPEDAWGIIVKASKPLGYRRLDFAAASGRVLASPVFADRDMPPADRSTRDGYAVRYADLGTMPKVLRVCGEMAAGSRASASIGEGECVRIFTGAGLPEGADTIVMIEDTEQARDPAEGPELVRILRAPEKGSNISLRGEIARRDDQLLPEGTLLGPAATGVCASAGLSSVEVHGWPVVSVIVTGAELRHSGTEIEDHQERNSNGPMLCAAIALSGFPVASTTIVTDDAGLIAEYLRTSLDRSEVVVVTGGTSVGKYDLVRNAIESVGGTILFRGVTMSPGKPTMFATAGEGKYIFGLPGKPLGALTAFHEFVLPLLRRLSGWPAERWRLLLRIPLADDVTGRPDRPRYVLGRITRGSRPMAARVVTGTGAGKLAAASRADGTIIVPPGEDGLIAGSVCDFRLWK
jgi:molybdopterin molybdotransferase